jgi:hypothetical protein
MPDPDDEMDGRVQGHDTASLTVLHTTANTPLSYFKIVFSVVFNFLKTLWTICGILTFQESGL